MRPHLPADIQRLKAIANRARDHLDDPDLDIGRRQELIRRLLEAETRLDRFHVARLADPYNPDHPRQLGQLETELTAILQRCSPEPGTPSPSHDVTQP